MRNKERNVKVKMLQLWDTHVLLTREVVIAASLNSPNLTSSLNTLLENQDQIGNQLGNCYGKRKGFIYAELLRIHINQAVVIVQNALAGKDNTQAIDNWYNNGRDISKFLSKVIPVNYVKMKKLFFEHLKCTLDEATLIIQRKYNESVVELYTCLKHVREMVLFLSKNFSCC